MAKTTAPSPAAARAERWRASPSFVLALTLEGRPYVAKETEPYIQYWVSERERQLLGQFTRRGGCTLDDALTAYARGLETSPTPQERQRALKAIAGMQAAGVLMRCTDDTSRYNARIVHDYVAHRPIPPEISQHIAQRGKISRHTRVIDLAGGPGDLALALATASDEVSLMELSRGFLAAARARARRRGVALNTVHDSCNRLVFRDEPYDVATVCQALHWLDDVQLCKGLSRLLQPGGSFFVVHSAIDLADDHPLAYLLGHDSILGAKPRQSFVDEVAPLWRRLGLLLEALDGSTVQRVDWQDTPSTSATCLPLGPADVALFCQRRPFDAGYAMGFLTPSHIAATGMTEAQVQADLVQRCKAAPADALMGTHHWAVLHFQRGARHTGEGWKNQSVRAMAYQPGTD